MRKEIFLKKASQIIAQEEATCGILSRVIDIATLRIGYTRIEHIPGRPLAFVALRNMIQRQGAECGE